MPGRRSTRTRDRVEDLTVTHYQRAWSLFSTGQDVRTIKRVCELSGAQWDALYKRGLPAKRGRKAYPGFEQRLAEEAAAIRQSEIEAAKEVGSRGVRVLANALANAETAQIFIAGVLRLTAERVEAELAKPVDRRISVDKLMPGEHTLKAVSVMRHVADGYHKAARAYDQIYRGGRVHPAGTAVFSVPGRGAAITGSGLATLPAALAMAEELLGDEGAERIAEEVTRMIMGWTPAQQEHYALTGEEPDPVIEATATEPG